MSKKHFKIYKVRFNIWGEPLLQEITKNPFKNLLNLVRRLYVRPN